MILRTTRAAVALFCATAVAVSPAGPAQAGQISAEQWHLRYLHVAEAHKISQGEGVTVAVIDTGVDSHPDLRRNLLEGFDVVKGGTGNGQSDANSHGTEIAGIICAYGGDQKSGALGIAPRAKVLPIRYQTAVESGNSDDIADGIRLAISNHAQIINISLTSGPSPALRSAIEAANRANIVVIAGAGNKPAYALGFPAAYDGVLTVGATDHNGNHADMSLTGPQLAISAPGVNILSTSKDGKYAESTGTSNSTAIVAGAAALVRSKFPQLSAKEVVHRLTATAVDKGAPGRDEVYGYGVLDLVAALTADVPPLKADGGAGPTTSAGAQPSATGRLTAPGDGRAGRGATLLIALGALAVIGLVVVLLVVRNRRRASG